MKKETKEYIHQNKMLVPGGRVIAGLSGGADSVCLLHVLAELKAELSFELRAVHVHHGLRGEEADRDARFSTELCERLSISCAVVRIDAASEAKAQGISVEEAGRNARYRILEEQAQRWEQEEPGAAVSIAAAHHGDDSAETILHNLFRGSGLKGLCGIAPVRGRIIRPLLWAGRKDILTYLKAEDLSYVEDSTNGLNEYTRNRLRNQILPLITSEINEKAVDNILRAGKLLKSADQYFEKRACEWIGKWGEAGGTVLPVSALEDEEKILQGYIVRNALKVMGCPLRDVTAGHVEDVLALSGRQTGKRVNLPYGILAKREYEVIRLLRCNEGSDMKAAALPDVSMRIFPFDKQQEIPKKRYTKWFDYDKIKGTLSVRYRRTGDYITLPNGGRKTVKSFMIDEKIPAAQRDDIALLAKEDHVLWIIGYRISEYYKITEDTQFILEVRLDGGIEGG